MPDIILSMTGISKSFGGVKALRGVNLEVAHGEVHALIGENGAGKSTLMKILSGAIKADNGEMFLDGEPYRPRDPLQARQTGISMVYQELNLAMHLTVEENLMLGIEKSQFGLIRRNMYRDRIREALDTLQHPDLTPNARVMDLSPAARQLVEIARGLITDTKVYVLDEPTSSLSKMDTEHLFGVINTLKSRNVSIIYISHFLEEIKYVADRFTVLRDGETVGHGDVRDTTTEKIIELMVGRPLTDMFPRIPHEIGEELISVSNISSKPLPEQVTFTVRRGEILGIAGLVGAGRTETLRILYGLNELSSGEIKISGYSGITGKITPPVMIGRKVAYLSEDRKNEGLALECTIAVNITLSSLKKHGTWGFVSDRTLNETSHRWVDTLAIKVDSVTNKVESLSGGNQQKVALARLLEEEADVFLLDEPTRGVDVGSKVEIFRLIGELASQGKALIIVSSYLPELLGICDTIAVMHRGILGSKQPVEQWDEFSIMNEATSGIEGTV
ncbi:MAG: sugar ABC transporter ATP-binding protein [Candidatus Latescibacteria bacterium]|nr:sugar ABC transporter ATP-binding protein [Candidatus Latescibacterota bacterium]